MKGKSKSILVQVVYKALKENGLDGEALETAIVEDYQLLVGLFDKLGIDPDEGGSSFTKTEKKKLDAPTVTINGKDYFDFRGLKAVGAIEKPRHPDFKAVEGGKGEWLTDQDGTTPTAFSKLVEKAGV